MIIYEDRINCISFRVSDFHCYAVVDLNQDSEEQVTILIGLCTQVQAGALYTFEKRVVFTSKKVDLHGVVLQYSAVGDGQKREFGNRDAIKQYGNQDILSQDEVSYYNVFVNAVLMPKSDYIMTNGCLEFITEDVPNTGQPICIEYVIFKAKTNQILRTENEYFFAISNGEQRIFEINAPDSQEVSFFNLYINGVLQPITNYKVEDHKLMIVTSDIPLTGSVIALEAIRIKGLQGQLIHTQAIQYNSYAKERKYYLNSDRIEQYNSKNIPDPRRTSLQNLYINGVMQPPINYRVRKDLLLLYLLFGQ